MGEHLPPTYVARWFVANCDPANANLKSRMIATGSVMWAISLATPVRTQPRASPTSARRFPPSPSSAPSLLARACQPVQRRHMPGGTPVRPTGGVDMGWLLGQPMNKSKCLMNSISLGGEGGIRTRDTLASMPHFECGAFNHSATSPKPSHLPLSL